VQCESIYAREHNVVRSRAYIDTSRPLGEPRYRYYVAYLAFNLINEGGSASVVTRPTITPMHFFPVSSLVTD